MQLTKHYTPTFSALTLLVGWQKGIRSVKNGGMIEVGAD